MVMNKNDTLKQITCIERLDDNAKTFDELTKHIQSGRPDLAVHEMASWNAVSDLDPYTYENILEAASQFNERIVYDDGVNLLAANNGIIVLYQYESID
jgi:hypothetical protein